MFMKRIQEIKDAGATIINITTPIPHIYEISTSLYASVYADCQIQNAYGWGDAVGTPANVSSNRALLVDLAAGYAAWLAEATFPGTSFHFG